MQKSTSVSSIDGGGTQHGTVNNDEIGDLSNLRGCGISPASAPTTDAAAADGTNNNSMNATTPATAQQVACPTHELDSLSELVPDVKVRYQNRYNSNTATNTNILSIEEQEEGGVEVITSPRNNDTTVNTSVHADEEDGGGNNERQDAASISDSTRNLNTTINNASAAMDDGSNKNNANGTIGETTSSLQNQYSRESNSNTNAAQQNTTAGIGLLNANDEVDTSNNTANNNEIAESSNHTDQATNRVYTDLRAANQRQYIHDEDFTTSVDEEDSDCGFNDSKISKEFMMRGGNTSATGLSSSANVNPNTNNISAGGIMTTSTSALNNIGGMGGAGNLGNGVASIVGGGQSISTATQTHEVRMPMYLPTFRPATGCTNASDFVVRCFVARLRSGITVVKHGRARWCKSRLRILHIHVDGRSLSWKPAEGEPSSTKRPPKLDLSTCQEVRHAWSPDPSNPMYTGTSILRQKCEAANAHKSFALIFQHRTVDVTAVTADQCKVLMEGFSALCFRLQVANLAKDDTKTIQQQPMPEEDGVSYTASNTLTNTSLQQKSQAAAPR